jgi:hypothetical protein
MCKTNPICGWDEMAVNECAKGSYVKTRASGACGKQTQLGAAGPSAEPEGCDRRGASRVDEKGRGGVSAAVSQESGKTTCYICLLMPNEPSRPTLTTAGTRYLVRRDSPPGPAGGKISPFDQIHQSSHLTHTATPLSRNIQREKGLVSVMALS